MTIPQAAWWVLARWYLVYVPAHVVWNSPVRSPHRHEGCNDLPSAPSAGRPDGIRGGRAAPQQVLKCGLLMGHAATFERVLAEARRDRDVIGLFLIGSRATDLYDERSDFDLCIVVTDENALREVSARRPSRHGDAVE